MKDNVNLISSSAGLRVILEFEADLAEEDIVNIAKNAVVNISPVSQYYMVPSTAEKSGRIKVMLSYKGIPLEDIESAIKTMKEAWFKGY